MNMTPEQALENLDNAVAAMNLNRETTLGLMTSVRVLQVALTELTALKAKGEAKPDDEKQRS